MNTKELEAHLESMAFARPEEHEYYVNLHEKGSGSVGLDEFGALVHVAPDGTITEIEAPPRVLE